MGMYTGIRFKGHVKQKFREIFNDIALYGDWEESNISEFKEFGNISRSSFIPCGVLSYMPDEWDNDSFNRSYDKNTGFWKFSCSLKNYDDTIWKFIELIPFFIETVEYFEYYFEELQYSQKWELINNKMIQTDDKFIKY